MCLKISRILRVRLTPEGEVIKLSKVHNWMITASTSKTMIITINSTMTTSMTTTATPPWVRFPTPLLHKGIQTCHTWITKQLVRKTKQHVRPPRSRIHPALSLPRAQLRCRALDPTACLHCSACFKHCNVCATHKALRGRSIFWCLPPIPLQPVLSLPELLLACFRCCGTRRNLMQDKIPCPGCIHSGSLHIILHLPGQPTRVSSPCSRQSSCW